MAARWKHEARTAAAQGAQRASVVAGQEPCGEAVEPQRRLVAKKTQLETPDLHGFLARSQQATLRSSRLGPFATDAVALPGRGCDS